MLYDQRYTDPAAVDQLDVAREVRDSAKKQWEEKIEGIQKLTIVAPATGTIIPPPAAYGQNEHIAGQAADVGRHAVRRAESRRACSRRPI